MNSIFESRYSQSQRQYKLIRQFDPLITRVDTCLAIKSILKDIEKVLDQINVMPVSERLENYFHTYNGVLFILDIFQDLKKSEFSFEAIEFLLMGITSLEGNLILQDAKYLDLRTKLYIQIAKLYEDQQSFPAAINILSSGVQKFNDLLALHQLDSPVPQHIKAIISNDLKLIKIMLIKYKIQGGAIPVVDFKKKVDEDFGQDQELKLICLIECLRTKRNKKVSIFEERKTGFKDSLVNIGYEMIKGDVQIIAISLEQQKVKIEKAVQLQNSIKLNITQQQINQQIKKKRQIEQKFIKQKDYARAVKNIPLQYHCELIHYAFQVKNAKIFNELSQWAVARIKYRSIQVPYITDISIITSDTTTPNIPNEYEKLPYDLNEANLKLELMKLRNSGKINPDLETNEGEKEKDIKDVTKDLKKGGKAPVVQKEETKKELATPWELEQIKHKYVYLLIKKSVFPDKAIYGINVALGNEDKGPMGNNQTRKVAVPFVSQKNVSIKSTQVEQYTGVRSTTNLIPFLVLFHSSNSLANQQQKKTVITDIKPIFGKNPMIRPSLGYNKIDLDLRQVPNQFIRSKFHQYVYLTYKTDNLFNIQQRHTEILISLNQLQLTYGKSNDLANTAQQQKLLQLGIDYSLESLNSFFQITYKNLGGALGQQYYVIKTDFLTQLCSYIWVKYLRQPLCQFDYLMEQRLTGQCNEYDYSIFKSIIDKCKPVFLVGLKIMNLVLASNNKSDLLLLCKLNLELAKLLEEEYQFLKGIENIKVCLESIDKYRNNYLKCGIQGKYDKLLPFAVTTSNMKLQETFRSIKDKYLEEKKTIAKMLRIRKRKEIGQKKLTEKELKDQQFEYQVKYDSNKVENDITEFEVQSHSEIFLTIVAVETELINCLIRLQLKEGEKAKKLVKERKRVNPHTKGLEESDEPITMKLKSSLVQQDTEIQVRRNLNEYQGTLQKAGKIEPTKPAFANHESKLLNEINKNPYKQAILLLNLGSINTKTQQRKYLFQQCLKTISKAYDEQEQILTRSVQNSIFLISRMYDKDLSRPSSIQQYPFNQVYSNDWIPESTVPISPILISKTSNSITMKLPPFIPIVKEKDQNEYKMKRSIESMTLYGKLSANGVDVSTNCISLEGTGIRRSNGSIVEVRNLETNNIYCFACSASNGKNQQGGIGKTGENVGAYNPLPLNIILGCLAKVTFQLNEYEISKNATQKIIDQYCQVTNFLDKNSQTNYLNYYKFKDSILQGLSKIQLQYLAESIYISARCKNVLPDKARTQSQKHNLITNLLMLSNSLAPLLSTPLSSLSYFIPQQSVIQRGLSIFLMPSKWMSPNLRLLSSKIMYNVLKWGLENNQITLSRRITYKWIERKWMLLGKLIQVEEKKEVKKGTKDNKDQETKLVDKYVRMLVEKSPGVIDKFEDAMITLHEEYSDYAVTSIEKTKQQIQVLSQYIDNPLQQLEKMTNQLNVKLEFIEYLKDPIPNIIKIPQTSLSYLQYSCKLLRRALQKGGETKVLIDSSNQIIVDYSNPIIKTAKEMQELIIEAIKGDIDWAPESVKELRVFQEKTGEDISKTISIFQKYNQLETIFNSLIAEQSITLDKNKQFRYNALWISQYNYLKAIILIIDYTSKSKSKSPEYQQGYYNINTLSLEQLIKKRGEFQVMDKTSYMQSPKSLEDLSKITHLLSESIYYCSIISNWSILQNVLKTLYNILSHCQLTPFSHSTTLIYEHLTLISFVAIGMLKKIKGDGYHVYRKEYQNRLKEKELVMIEAKINGNLPAEKERRKSVEEKHYYRPSLETKTSKTFWFKQVPQLELEVVISIVCYNIQCLLVQNKHPLSISVIRQFSNITNHLHSLSILPFLINSQEKILEKVVDNLNVKKQELGQVELKYNNWKNGKKKGSRQAQLTGQKQPQQIEYEQNSGKLNQTIKLIQQKIHFLKQQQSLSLKIIQQIKRDSNQISLKQKENHRMLVEFSKDETRMLKQYGDQNRLINNRKNTFKQLLGKYTKVLQLLQSSKDLKDELSQIQNLNEAGNLAFAVENIKDAETHWMDCLTKIVQTVNPIFNYRQVIEAKQPSPIDVIGLKQSLLAINVLKKLGTVCYSKNLHMKREAIFMSSALIKSIFKTDSTHPILLQHYNTYRLKQISSKSIPQLRDNVTVNLSQLLDSCQLTAWGLIDLDRSILALPSICLMQHLSTDIVKSSHYSMRSKLLKSLSSSISGYIKQSIASLLRCYYQKDMPVKWIQQTQYLKREEGVNWPVQQMIYNNSLPPHNKQNNQILQQLSKLEINKKFQSSYGMMNSILFQICKAMILFSSNEIQIANNYQLNQQRALKLINAETILRSCLKKISLIQQCSTLLQSYKDAEIQYKLDQTNDDKKRKLEQSKSILVKYLKSNSIPEDDIPVYLQLQPTVERRIQRLDLIARVRVFISRINQARGLWTRSFYVLKNAVWNMYWYSIGGRSIETGQEKENEELAMIQNKIPAGGKKEEKKDDKKGAKKDIKQELKQQSIIKPDQSKLLQHTLNLKQRSTISFFFHLKLKLQLLSLLFRQNRFKQSLVLSQQITSQSQQYNDYHFSLLSQGFAARCRIKLGEVIDTKQMEKVICKLEENKLTDSRMFIELVGDCAEMLGGEAAQRLLSVKEQHLESLAEEVGIRSYILSQNNNGGKKQYCVEQQLSPQAEQQIKRKTIKKPIDLKKGGKQQKKNTLKKQDLKKKKQQQRSDYKIQTLSKMEWVSLNSQQKSTYNPINPESNSTMKDINCYLKEAELYVKYKLRKIDKGLQVEVKKISVKDVERMREELKNVENIVSKSYGFSQGILLTFKYLQSRVLQCSLSLRFTEFILSNKDTLPAKILKRFSQNLPLNPLQLTIPGFQPFVFSNKPIIQAIIQKLKQCVNLIINECIVYEYNFNVYKVFFSLGFTYLLLGRYQGSATPKYIEVEQNKGDAMQEEMKARRVKLMQEGRKYLIMGIEVKNCKRELSDNYCELGKKAFETGNYKIDPAIESQILQIDYLCRKQQIRLQNQLNLHRYRRQDQPDKPPSSMRRQPKQQILFDQSKKKTQLNFIDILTFILKLSRQSKTMTFTNSHLQNSITKCHKILFNLLPMYKEKCVLKDVEKKREKVESDSIVCLIENVEGKCMLLYVLGMDSTPESTLNYEETVHGYILVSKKFVNQMSCLASNLKEKMQQSDKKSPAQKERDYRLYNEEYERILKRFVEEFGDEKQRGKEGVMKEFKGLVPELSYGLIEVLVSVFEGKGVNEVNKNMNRLFRYANWLNVKG